VGGEIASQSAHGVTVELLRSMIDRSKHGMKSL